MTPKEQALRIWNNMYLMCNCNHIKAKTAVIYVVTMIINANPHSNPLNTDVHSTMQYWLDVKTELENIK